MKYQEIQHLETRDLWEKGSATIGSNCQYSLNGDGPMAMLSLVHKSGFKRSQSDASRLTLEHKKIVYKDPFSLVFFHHSFAPSSFSFLFFFFRRHFRLLEEEEQLLI